jgi:plastocyanin
VMFSRGVLVNLSSVPYFGFLFFVFAAGFPPFDDATQVDLTLHMLQHVLIVLAGVLVAYPIFRTKLPSATKRSLLPKAGLATATILILFWHFPGPWDSAVLNPAVHLLEHVSFLVVGLLSGSLLLRLSDSAKIGALLAAFFGHMAYAVALISPWNIQLYELYTLPDQNLLGWVLLLTGPTLIAGIAYVIARNPGWLGSTGTAEAESRRETFLNRVKVPKWVTPSLTVALIVVLVGYFAAAAVAVTASNPAIGANSSRVYIEETPVSWQYTPQNLTVVAGVNSTIVWVSHSISYDTVTDRGGTFSSGPIAPGQSFEFAFTQPGVYHYYCIYHPWMFGTIVVPHRSG